MPGPWENYAATPATSGPWANYGAPAVEPSALSRAGTSFREGLNIPANAVDTFLPGAKYAAQNPVEAAKATVEGPVEGYKAAVTEQHQRMVDAYNRGDYGQTLLHGLYYLLAPVGGVQMGKATEQAVKGDYAGSLGTSAAAALPLAVGSPEVRANVGAATATAREAVATGLTKSAGPVSVGATVVGALHELASGRLESAAITASLGKTAIGKTMNTLADFIKPGENAAPMPLSHATIQNALDFLKSPGMEGEAAKPLIEPSEAQAVYDKAAAQELPKTATAKEISAKSDAIKAQDTQTAKMLDDAISQLKVQGLYGKTPTKSNLAANQRQLASPTGSTAPVPAAAEVPDSPFWSMGRMKNYRTK